VTYRPEHLFALRQSLAAFHYYHPMVVEVDQEIQGQLGSLGTATTAEPTVPKRTKASAYQRRRYEPKTFDLRGELYRVFGVDLTNVPGISAITDQTILCEIRRCVPVPQCLRLCILAGTLSLGEFFRRITRKLGKPQAITATAHNLARIVYHLLSTREAY
jgi:hypothetical protein